MDITTVDQELSVARDNGPLRTLVIPPCPELLTRLQAAMRHDDPDWDEVHAIAAADVAMSASLVRAANSPMYARRTTVHSVEQAMSLLGLRQVAALLTGFLSARALPVNHPALEDFWLNSSRRAVAMGYIARQLYDLPADLAHTFGLFCDVGLPLLLQSLPGYAGTLAEAGARRDRSFTATEQAAHRTDHAIVGALVARTWRLHPHLMVAIRLHHDVHAVEDSGIDPTVRSLVATCVVADHLTSTHAGFAPTIEWTTRKQGCLNHLHVQEDEITLWQDALETPFEALR
ncbi:HD-like signal output (HDOD) protein [Sphaerotilus hippei]|uniref:HD-like signal output (HDOD) protein n=1 Tax=Sphaerotilus hippei TaxID=744406 RepID=A0A318HF41_9BURK|nr:HDOD domain-containing protein [Sphaerotilus hippei]PXW98529.1 HD-like signal output (HDOD) protein [Sphaerotilus hippei]